MARRRAAAVGLAGIGFVLCTELAVAQPSPTSGDAAEQKPPASAEPDASTLEARKHFKTGTKLYRDGNYGGALAEFEEAYRLKPGPGSLQNVALSQKGLFRYAEAASTLEQLLDRHGAELDEGERKAVEEALTAPKALIASIKLHVTPEDARIVLDGQKLEPSTLAAPIVLNVGEHSLSVEAPGFGPERRVLRVAGGQREVPVNVDLRCLSGFVDVTSSDPTANIAIDGIPKARRAYRGPVEPDIEHLVQVYREGVEPFEQTFRVGLCKTVPIRAQLEPSDSAASADESESENAPPSAPPKRVLKGFYGMLSLDLLGLSKQPLNLDVSKAQSGGGLGALGLRGGYRISNPVAIDAMLDLGVLNVVGAPDMGGTMRRDYSLHSVHFGPDLKLMTTGEKLRFVTTVGAGIVHHRLAVASSGSYSAAQVSGVDPYFLLELSLGFNYGQFMGELGLIAVIDGSTALRKGFQNENRDLTSSLGTTLPMAGIGLRLGLSQWRPAH